MTLPRQPGNLVSFGCGNVMLNAIVRIIVDRVWKATDLTARARLPALAMAAESRMSGRATQGSGLDIRELEEVRLKTPMDSSPFDIRGYLVKIETIGIVGAGTMGSGIAQAAVIAGLRVVLVDVSEKTLATSVASLSTRLERMVQKDQLDGRSCEAAVQRLVASTDYRSIARADLVIEAATERADIKAAILREIESTVAPDAIIATNTSSISITSLAAALERPHRFIGIHFFNPVPVLPLVEVIPGLQSSRETVDFALQWARHIGKSPIVVSDSPGFVVNRLLIPMLNEAFFILAEGVATAEEIDAGMRLGASHTIGPLALADLIGLDVCLSIMDVLQKDLGDSRYCACPLLRELVAAGRLGRKRGRGVFQYDA